MIFVNDPGGYQPLNQLSPYFLGKNEPGSVLEKGLHFRGDLPVGYSEYAQKLLADSAAEPFKTYEYWVDNGWKEPHATIGSTDRLGDKLKEEVIELVEAVNELEEGVGNNAHILAELGDVLWCTTGLANNGGGRIDAGLRLAAFKYSVGIKFFDRMGDLVEPKWRNALCKFMSKYTELTIHDFDELMSSGFEPYPSYAMNLEDEDIEEEVPFDSLNGHVQLILLGSLSLINNVRFQFGNDRLWQTGDRRDDLSVEVAEIAAGIYLHIGYIAHKLGGYGLKDVIEMNVSKIQKRVNAGRVDIQDGERTKDML